MTDSGTQDHRLHALLPGMAHYFDPPGECIYCGSRDGPLGNEHIVPYGLGGSHVIRKASCETCAKVTSSVEGRLLRGFLLEARGAGNFPTRRPRQRPSRTTAQLLDSTGQVHEREVDVATAPGFVVLPTLQRASFLEGRPPTTGYNVIGSELVSFGTDPRFFVNSQGMQGQRAQSIVPVGDLARLVAKAAYSYAVATMGLFPREETPLLDILFGVEPNGGRWIGSRTYTLAMEKEGSIAYGLATYGIEASEGRSGVVALVKLFASSGATGFEALVRLPGWRSVRTVTS